MKNTFLILVALLFSLGASAQEDSLYVAQKKKENQAEKKALIKEAIVITNEEQEVFWPLYNEYNSKMEVLNDQYLILSKQYNNSRDKLSYSEVMDLWEEMMDVKQQLLKLERKYYKKMINQISPVKVVNYFEIERDAKIREDAEFIEGEFKVSSVDD
jgi:hypothetical protein